MTDPDLDRALEAMTAPELRSFVRGVLDGIEGDQRAPLVDSLVARAARGDAGWKPSEPSRRIVDEATQFAQAARRSGSADPDDVSAHLREGSKAFLAGDHASARAVFEALLPPIANVDIDLGQHELVDDVLNVDARMVVAQYVTGVYTATPLDERAKAVDDAIQRVAGFASLGNPIADMEGASAGVLPELGLFLPRWVKRLERLRPSKEDWENDHERWLREAVFRLDGVMGLERIARKTKRAQACLAWCEALAERGDWAGALRAFDMSAALVGKSHWRGLLLDGATLAAQQLGRPDVSKRLEAAWRGVPTLTRLLRWLVADGGAQTAFRAKRRRLWRAVPERRDGNSDCFACSWVTCAPQPICFRRPQVWVGRAEDHPGHVLFPLFAALLAKGTPRAVSPALLADLESTSRDHLEVFSDDEIERRPKLATPSIGALAHDLCSTLELDHPDREAMLGAMCIAAERRIEGILSNSRRRHYGHAAMLAASCLALAPTDRRKDLSAWLVGLRQTYSRRHAFREELTRAMESLGASSSD